MKTAVNTSVMRFSFLFGNTGSLNDRTYSVPTARHWNRLAGFERISGGARSKVRPRLHHSGVTFRVSQGKGIVEGWRLGEVERACCCIITITGLEKALHVFGLGTWTSVVLQFGQESWYVVRSTYSEHYIIQKQDLVEVLTSLREILQRLEYQVSQIGKIGNAPQFFCAS